MLTNPEILEIMRIRLLRLIFWSLFPWPDEVAVTEAGRSSQCRMRARDRYKGATRLTVITELMSSTSVQLTILHYTRKT